MLRSLRPVFLLAGWLLALAGTDAAEPAPGWWQRLALRDLQGAPVAPAGRWLVVVFLSPECPVANAELPVLNALAREYTPQGFAFAGAYADPGIELDILRRHAADSSLAFPAVDDRAQRLAHEIGASYTPEAFVFSANGSLLYRGRIDDRVEGFGPARPKATHENLRDVLAALASGQPGPFPNQPGFGCALPKPVKP